MLPHPHFQTLPLHHHPGLGILFDRLVQAALLLCTVEFHAQPDHVIGGFALGLPLLVCFDDRDMVAKLRATGASPCTREPVAALAFGIAAFLGVSVVFFVGMFAEALEVVGSVGRNVVEALALALGGFAEGRRSLGVEVLMFFEAVVAEAFGFGADHLALHSFFVAPAQVESVLAFLGDRKPAVHDVQLLKLFQVLLRNHAHNN